MPSIRTAFFRHAVHYANALRAARELYMQGGINSTRGLKALDANWANIQAGQVWTVQNIEADAQAAELCSHYPDFGTRVLTLRQSLPDRIQWRQAALTAARRLNDESAIAVHLGNLGSLCADVGDMPRALEY